jgi:hypothetical protein
MSQVRSIVHGLVKEAQEILFKKLMKVNIDAKKQVDPQQGLLIYWDSMVDNPSESRVGWSFLDEKRNKFYNVLYKRVSHICECSTLHLF